MITRIRYTKVYGGCASFNIPLSSELTVRIEITNESIVKILKLPECDTLYEESCTSLQMAKRKARKKLQELGLNFNNEIRRKK